MENEREDGFIIDSNEDNDTQNGSESLRERSMRRRLKREREPQHRKQKKQGFHPVILGLGILILMMVLVVGGFMYKKYAPSKTVMPLTEFFDSQEGEILLMLHDTVLEERAFMEDDQIYLPYEVVVDHINQRFYFDSSENMLSYATATEIIRSEVGSTAYYMNKSKMDEGYAIVKAEGEQVYLALDFVKEFSNLESTFFENPDRLMLEAGWGNTYEYYRVNKSTKLRYKPGIKCDILESLDENDVLRVVHDGTEEMESYAKVMTADGVTGYVMKKYLSDKYEETLTNDYKEEEYSHITKDETISMAWHQVTSQDGNNGLLNTVSSAKGLNVISPTWFSVASSKGEVSSLASELYVRRAHNQGIEVWALCDDFAVKDGTVDMATLLGNTTNRDKLTNRLLAYAIEYDLDGLNIDFENVTEDTAAAYLEFLRELSVKCRNNGIVLSVDSYVPSNYTAYYDREEQGKVVDYVVVMAYDEHYGGSKESGSVASIGFVQDAVEQITQMVDPSRVIIGIPFYTRLWREQDTENGVKVTSSAYGMTGAEGVLANNGVSASWDETTGQNYVEFQLDDSTYKMWMEDADSLERKLDVIFAEYDGKKVAGISAWKLGLEKSSIWNTILKYTN